jgi:hypothetical protein
MQDGTDGNEESTHCFACSFEGLDPLFTGEKLVHKDLIFFFAQPEFAGTDPIWARAEL